MSLFNLFLLQELRLMAGIGIEVGFEESGSKFGYRNRDRNWATGIGIEVGLQELRSKMETKLVRSKLRSN